MKTTRFYSYLFAFLISFLLGMLPAVQAQDIPDGKGSLLVNPLIIEMKLEEGKDYERQINIKNINSVPYDVIFEAFDVEIEKETHNVQFLPVESLKNKTRSLASWVSLRGVEDGEFVLQPGEEREVTADVIIPVGVDAGDYYASLNFYFREQGKDNFTFSGVDVRQSIGSLLLVNINGENADTPEGSDYQFSELKMDPNGTVIHVGVEARNNTLRYVHLKPQLSIWNEEGEIQYQSMGKSVRVFPGEMKEVWHSFPKEYLTSVERLTLGYVLWDQQGKEKYFEGEVLLETAYSRMKVFQKLLVGYGEWFFFLLIAAILGGVLGLWVVKRNK